MHAAFITQPGPPSSIQWGDFPDPKAGSHQCLVKVGAVSVNPIDTYIRGGLIPMKVPMPYIVGCDVAGMVEAVGPGVTRYKVGDRVWGSNQGLLGRQGTFAERVAVEEKWLYPTPLKVADEQAAAVALVGITAHLGLVGRVRLQPKETLFVHGGSGGVGSMVVQMAKAIGARVITSAGSDAKAETCRRLGADDVILYQSESTSERLKEMAPSGVNVWWETLREPDFEGMVSHLAPRGRVVLMAGRDARPVFPVGPFYVKDCSLHGFAMFNASAEEQEDCARAINGWMEKGSLTARIDRIMALSEAAAAHALQEENTLRRAGTLAGKIVLKP